MYNVIKNVISTKNYELKDMLNKLDTLWVQGSISDDQRIELIATARKNAVSENSLNILLKIEELDRRVAALEAAGSQTGGEPSVGETVTYPDFKVGKWYRAGDKITFDNVNYICVAPNGQVCTWSPIDFPDYWAPIVDKSENEDETDANVE